MTLEDSMAHMRVLFNLEASDEYKIAASTAAAKHEDARKALIEFAQNEQDEIVRVMAISALIPLAAAEHGDAVDALNTIAKDENAPLRQFAANALESLAAEHEYVRKALIGIATDLILEILSNPNSDEHKIADLTALAQKDADAREVLIHLAEHFLYYNAVRRTAVKALGPLAENHDDARKALIGIAKRLSEIVYSGWERGNQYFDDVRVRNQAIEVLIPLAAEHGDARAALNEIAQDENDPLHQFAADALESLETQETQTTIGSLDPHLDPTRQR